MSSASEPSSELPPADPERKRHGWVNKFRVAFRGLKFGIRGESSFAVHFLVTILVIVVAAVLRCELWQWCVLIGCIAFVLTAELLNSALETLFRGLDDGVREKSWPALDIAAGAVLLASIAASIVGGLIFIQQLMRL